MLVTILLFPEVDLLDAGGPYEVFLTASRLAVRDGDDPPFRLRTATPDGAPVTAYGGLTLTPHGSLAEALPADVVIVPGTIDIDAALANPGLMRAIDACRDASDGVLASVCTGAFLLAGAGLLADRAWTTHWEDIDGLADRLGPDGARRDVRWVDDGRVVTAAGLSAGLDMALHLVERFAGRSLAERTARQIDYHWRRDA